MGKTHKTVTPRSELPLSLSSSVTLPTAYQQFLTDVSGQPIIPIVKGQEIATRCVTSHTSAHLVTSRRKPEIGRSVFSTHVKPQCLDFTNCVCMYRVNQFSSSERKITIFVPNRYLLLRHIRENAGSCHRMSRQIRWKCMHFKVASAWTLCSMFVAGSQQQALNPLQTSVYIFINELTCLNSSLACFHPGIRTRTNVSSAVCGICQFTSC